MVDAPSKGRTAQVVEGDDAEALISKDFRSRLDRARRPIPAWPPPRRRLSSREATRRKAYAAYYELSSRPPETSPRVGDGDELMKIRVSVFLVVLAYVAA